MLCQIDPPRPAWESSDAIELLGGPDTEAIEQLVAAVGRSDFEELFFDRCTALCQPDQIVIFAVEGGVPRCLIARRADRRDIMPQLLRRYARDYMARDSFLGAAMAAPDGHHASIVYSGDIPDEAYRRHLFIDAGLAGKLAAVSLRDGIAFYINLYYTDLRSARFLGGVAHFRETGRLLLELFRKHYVLRGSVWSSPSGKYLAERYVANHLPRLSAREIQVCARILCGYSTDAIGDDLAVSRTTVKTFRRRAYAKLGICTQNELFARCAGLAH